MTVRIDSNYSSVERLKDGTEVRLRLIGPDDRERLRAGFRALSSESRYRRFLSPTPRLSATMLRALTETDGWNHVAIGAERVVAGAGGDGLGVARFVRLKGTPDTAEAAIAVIDEYQGRGLGGLLLRTLVAAARERGVAKFRAYVLGENEPVKKLLAELAPHPAPHIEDGMLLYEIPLPEAPFEIAAEDPLYRLFKSAAEGLEIAVRAIVGRRGR